MTTLALIPFGPATIYIFGQPTQLVVANVDIGLLFLFAITSIGVYGVALAGWSSNSKYSLFGGLRSSAQMISYEVSLTLSVVGVLLLAGSLNFNEIIEHQRGYWYFIPRWNVVPQIIGFLCYITAAIAETNRVPFDLPEAETELVAGYHTEYSSFKFAMFFMAEYANMITVSCLATILFFGGWLSPFPDSWTWAAIHSRCGTFAAWRVPFLRHSAKHARDRARSTSRRHLAGARRGHTVPASDGNADYSRALLVH